VMTLTTQVEMELCRVPPVQYGRFELCERGVLSSMKLDVSCSGVVEERPHGGLQNMANIALAGDVVPVG